MSEGGAEWRYARGGGVVLVGEHQQLACLRVGVVVVEELPHAFDEFVVAVHAEQDVAEFDAHVAVFVEKAHAEQMIPFGDRLVVQEFAVVDIDGLAEHRQERLFVMELATPSYGLRKDVDIDVGVIGEVQADGGRCGKHDIGQVGVKDLFEAEERYAQVVVSCLMREIWPQRVTQIVAAMAHLGVRQQQQKQVDGALGAPALGRDCLAVEMTTKCTERLYAELCGGGRLVPVLWGAGGGCKFHMNPPWCGGDLL